MSIDEITLSSALDRELVQGCHGRPTKRLALSIAKTLVKRRASPWELRDALVDMSELTARLMRAKV